VAAQTDEPELNTMTPERWQKVKTVLYQALELPPERRPEFLGRACSGDDSLRKEVESLLSAGEEGRGVLLQSSEFRVTLPAGTKLEHYEVQSLLGAGGMGEVYRGHDPRLGRDVAIKILPRVFANDPDRLRRFEQEARAAAALNHPNILAIYDVGTTNQAIPYVVSELLEGETLRQCLMRGPLSVRKTVDLALQMASGLAAAHEKGIIHRDLKPENLFLTKGGHLKILDFGLAKLVAPRNSASPDARTLTRETSVGVVMGTVGYMPPEQVRGLAVDQRSDIFAAGAIVYEMLSGKRAFQGQTTADTIEAILNREPPALSQTIPPAFERVVRRCLEKDANERFHSVRDVAFALEALSDLPISRAGVRAGVPAGRSGARRRLYAFGGLAVLALSMAVADLYYRTKTGTPITQEWEQLTNFPDSAISPALSPDGRMLAFLRGTEALTSSGDLYLKLLPQGEPFQLTHDTTLKATPAFSPDGSRIAYTVAPPWDTWVVPVLGGKTQLMLPNASGLTWVDDRHILFSEIKSGIHMAVVTASESRAEQRDVYVPAQEEGMAHHSYLSPDHKWVLIATEMGPVGDMPCRLVPFGGSSPGRVVGPPDYSCTYAGWSPDGTWMFFSANNWTGSGFHLWRQRFPDGAPEQFTFGPTEQEGLAVAPDGRSLLTSVGLDTRTVWVHDQSGDRQTPFEGSARLPDEQRSSRAIFSPDGTRLYFLGRRNSNESEELWVTDLSSGLSERPLPGMSVANSFDVSADGKQIVFDSFDAQSGSHLWVASLDRRSSPRRLESVSPESNPVWGLTGDLFFQAQEGGHSYLYRRPLYGGQPTKVTPSPVARFETISPDGKWLVAEAPIGGEEVTRAVVAYLVDDGTAKRVCHTLCIIRWSQDGRFLYIGLPVGRAAGNYKTFIVPLHHGDSFPDLPATGIKTETDLTHLSGVKVINDLARPGPNGSLYAFDRSTRHRNVYRIPIR
jgi:Tol biopolymer transport system component